MSTILNDIRFALRMVWKRPGSTIVIVCTLGLVIGTLSLALGAIRHERSAWVPFPEADRLVRLWRMRKQGVVPSFPPPVYAELQRRLKALETIAAVGSSGRYVLTGRGEPKTLVGTQVSASVFSMCGIAPQLGRTFTLAEERSGEVQSVVLSYDAWQEHFGGDASVLGRMVKLDDTMYAVLGVMPEGYNRNTLFAGTTDFWLPGRFEAPTQRQPWVEIVGKLGPDTSLSQLRTELDVVVPQIPKTGVSRQGLTDSFGNVDAFPIDKRFGRVEAGPIIFAAIIPLFVVLIACFNITTLLVARVGARRREFAVRSALGAGRYRLVRQLLMESVMLALCSGLGGLLGASWIASWTATRGLPTQFNVGVLGIVAAVTLGIGLAVGWLPAWRATRRDLVRDLKAGGGAAGGVERHRLRRFLVAGQVAMATVLCISTGFLVRSYLHKQRFEPGFNLQNLVSVNVSLRPSAYQTPDQRLLYCEQALERIRAVAGVADVGVCSTASIDRYVFPISFGLENDGNRWWTQGRMANISIVSPNYLKMVNVPVSRGRQLTDADHGGSHLVALVNQTLAEQFFGEHDPMGRQICLNVDKGNQWFTIVGIVPDRPNLGPARDLGAEVYLSHQQAAPLWAQYYFLARTKAAPVLFCDGLRQALQSVDPDQPVSKAFTVQSRLQERKALHADIAGIKAMGITGLFGLIMSVLGIYGVVSNSVFERTHELGVRRALGAGHGAILGHIIKEGMILTFLGLGVGLVLAVGVVLSISQLLYGVSAGDPVTYLLVTLMFVSTAFVASLLPARRAMRIDPMAALRYE